MENKSDDNNEWESTAKNFREVLNVAIAAINHVAKTVTDKRGMISDALMLGNILTAISLNQLLEPVSIGGIPKLSAPDPFSIGVLARAIVETRLILFSLTRQTLTVSQADLRICWWEWHEICERIRTRDLIKSKTLSAISFDQVKIQLAKQIQDHPNFTDMPSDLKKAFIKGSPPRRATFETLRELAILAGVTAERFEVLYQLTSASAHRDPAVVALLSTFNPTDDQVISTLRLHINEATAFLAFTVEDFAKVFPAARQVISIRFRNIFQLWAGVYSQPF